MRRPPLKSLAGWLLAVSLLAAAATAVVQASTPAPPTPAKGFDPTKAIAAWKEPLPAPPAKVDDQGKPWVAVDQVAALERAHQATPLVKDVLREDAQQRAARLGQARPTIKDMKYTYVVLDSPIIKREEDRYAPVRFNHRKHAGVMQGDCLVCHHARPADPQASDTTKCSACHQDSFNPTVPDRPGLKAAYHRQCLECHQKRQAGPTGCTDCHAKNVPDHAKLVNLPDRPDPLTVTKECLRCHQEAADHLQKSAHWLWRGPSPHTLGKEKRVDLGKATNTINNFCIALPSNWPRCTSCHAGYGWSDANFDFNDQSRMDCLVCHDTTGTYAKVPTAAGYPFPQVDLKAVAQKVGHPSRKNCGDCHFQGGGGDAVKHGDMNGILYYPSKNCDVHMGGMDFACQECHKTRNHQISGRSLSLPVAEGSATCQDCHSARPHQSNSLLDQHLNRHVEHLFCVTCHSPVYAKCRPTKVWWDWSQAGYKQRKPVKDKYGEPDYNWQKGVFAWQESARPTYAWYNGQVQRMIVGDAIGDQAVIDLTRPVGALKDHKSRIYPFKLMEGIQPADAKNNILLVPHLFGPGGFWATIGALNPPISQEAVDQAWHKAFATGMEQAAISDPGNRGIKPYSGQYKWVKTRMYWGLTHETMPAKAALGCAQCHPSLAGDKTCSRCHQDNRQVDFKALAHRGTDFSWMQSQGRDVGRLVGQTDYLDFKSLGYKGDPIVYGGRFKQLPLTGGSER